MDLETQTTDELANTLSGLQLAALKAGAYLSARCGDADEARRQISLALDLPPPVLERRHDVALEKMAAGDELTIAEVAAWIACGIHTINRVTAILTRKQSGASLQ